MVWHELRCQKNILEQENNKEQICEAQWILISQYLIWNVACAFKFQYGLTPQSGSVWHNTLVKGEEREGILWKILKNHLQDRAIFF